MQRRQIAENIAKFRLRHGRGHGLLDFIIQLVKNIVYLGAMGYLIKDWFHIQVSNYILIGIAILYEIICYSIGYVDEKIGFWKFENKYSMKELNPFMEELNDKIDKINERSRN